MLVKGRRYVAVPESWTFDGRKVLATVCGDEGQRRLAVPQEVVFAARPVAAMASCFEGQFLAGWRVVAVPQNVAFDGRPVYVFACCGEMPAPYYPGSGPSGPSGQAGPSGPSGSGGSQCCHNPGLPTTLHATFQSRGTFQCDCSVGATVALTWDGPRHLLRPVPRNRHRHRQYQHER
jgi:hypothetical protein